MSKWIPSQKAEIPCLQLLYRYPRDDLPIGVALSTLASQPGTQANLFQPGFEFQAIVVVAEKILDKYTDGLNKTIISKGNEILQHIDYRLGITDDNSGGRLGNIEGRLDSIEEKLDRILEK